ncbi:MAG: endolytic transglycosylase MltG [Candidatus Margulisbacteria bacterium]|nr:endolytic transglycosylase MltG [Candidatus Margulisiibacteriota bacterium]
MTKMRSYGIVLFLVMMAWGVYATFIPMSKEKTLQEITIPSGATLRQISHILKSENLIRSQYLFLVYSKIYRLDHQLRAGVFSLSPSYALPRLVGILQEKEGAASLVKITIPEGYLIDEIGNVLAEKGLAEKGAFLQAVATAKEDFNQKYPFLSKVPTSNLEGYLFPETYIFAKGVHVDTIVDAFLKTFQSKIMPIWDANKDKTLSLHEMVTLASIVQQEAYLVSEMPLISGVFHNRLKKKMLLASCPTVAYAMGDPHKRLLTYKDLEFESDYNTYRRRGLPPTPIASPGTKAFEAAMHPEKTSYLYFVSNQDGSHSFNTTLYQHHRRQQEILKQNK